MYLGEVADKIHMARDRCDAPQAEGDTAAGNCSLNRSLGRPGDRIEAKGG